MAVKTKSRTKRAGSARRSTPAAKFAGTVELTPPPGGRRETLRNGSRVVASIFELSVAGLPERGARSELQLDVGVRTTTEKGHAVGGSWSSGVYYYVSHGSRLNLSDAVVFDGIVHQHLSFDLALVEREMPRIRADAAAALAAAAAEAAVELSAASGPVGTALGAFPGILGGILKLNGDDQVLKHTFSLFTREVSRPEDSPSRLLQGRYRLEKKRVPGAKDAWVTLLLDVHTVE